MGETDNVSRKIIEFFDRQVSDLSQLDYKEVLEEVISDLEIKLDCVTEELKNAEENGD